MTRRIAPSEATLEKEWFNGKEEIGLAGPAPVTVSP
jgi:hypothetical protein